MAAAAATEQPARGMPVPWAGTAAGLSLASAPLHLWALLAHRHSAVMAAILLVMTAACTVCAVRVLRSLPRDRSDDSELRGLLLMADAMALAHAMLLLPAGGHHHGGHSSPVALGAGHASGATASMLLVALELAVAASAALARRSHRRALA